MCPGQARPRIVSQQSVVLPEGRNLSLRRETVITQPAQFAQHFNGRVQRTREEPNIAIHEPIENEYLLFSLSAQKTSVFMTGNGGEMKTKALARLKQGQLARTDRERRHEKYTVWRISRMIISRRSATSVDAPLRVRSVDVAVALLRVIRDAATSGKAEISESDVPQACAATPSQCRRDDVDEEDGCRDSTSETTPQRLW